MTIQTDTDGILDLLICPGFCVKDNQITRVNQAAAAMLIEPGTDICTLLLTGAEEYADFHSGCLYLQLKLAEGSWGAAVTRREDGDYFLLDQSAGDDALRALGLAARELRSAMTGAIVSAEQLAQQVDPENPQARDQLARLSQGLHRTLRIIGNMSDAEGWPHQNRQEIREIGSLLWEILEKAQSIMDSAGVRLTFEGLREQVYTLVDREQLERAILNILSNAMKFTPKNGTIHISVNRRGRMLRFSIQDSGCGIPESIRGTLFTRYLRQGALEDSRYGLGLGMVLVRSAAAAHGGTVLVDQPEKGGTRVTMTLAIRQDSGTQLRSPRMHLDYAGEWDHVLLELADCLPYTLYQK